MSLHSPEVYAQIVDSYIDGYRKRGWMPECRANNLPGWTQGGRLLFSIAPKRLFIRGGSIGSSGDVIVGHFAINYHNEANALGIDLAELYAAQLADAELNPPEWNIQGRQSNVYKSVFFSPHLCFSLCARADRLRCFCSNYGYAPCGALDPYSIGRTTREGSRTLEVSAV